MTESHNMIIANSSNSVELYTETFGNKLNPAILLIIGAGAVSTLYPDYFCEALANESYYVIRYDQRDYGRSTHFKTVSQEIVNKCTETHDGSLLPYSILDLVDDAITILDHLSISQADVVGYSTGGLIAQILAIKFPKRLNSICSMSVGPATRKIQLKPIPQETWEVLLENITSGDFDTDISGWLKSFRYLNGNIDFDEDMAISYIKDIYEFEKNVDVAWNHIAIQHCMPDYYEQLQKISTKTLVIHGAEDKLQLPDYGKATAKLIPEAQFHLISKAGHMFFNNSIWQEIFFSLLNHIRMD